MVFKIDFIDNKTISWTKTCRGVETDVRTDYKPRFYIEGNKSDLHRSRPWISSQEGVVATSFEKWKPTLSKPEQKVLRVDVSNEETLKTVVNKLKKGFGRSRFRFYNTGFSPQFRFCIQNKVCPLPEEELSKLDLRLHRKHLAKNDISPLLVDEEKAGDTEKEVLDNLRNTFRRKNPDILMVNRGQLLELLNNKIDNQTEGFSLGRLEKFQQLAGENTVSSYGKTVHSNSRYNVPGRIVIDQSNSFLLKDATLEGLWDLVERSYRPLQELAWGSIGRVLTSIEVKKAYLEDNTLTPWKNWSGEKPKKASVMHKADRGGFIFNPEPSIHENVYEADFASLFPNIMIKKNISPETVCCDCCDNSKVPELEYSICERQSGFISEILKPLVEDRQQMKELLKQEDPERREIIQGSADAIKWLLVSCFGYMGHSHASYGAIRCHQAIQAFDREIMLKTKEIFEKSGYRVAHGIIDSMWVQKNSGSKVFEELCDEITEETGILLEPEHKFEWCAFVPRSSSSYDAATLNRYFGKTKEGEFITAGIELEQDSACEFVRKSQMDMIKAIDCNMSPEDVFEVLEKRINYIESMNVPVEDLSITKTVSKPLEKYEVENRNVAAIRRLKKHGIDVKPGQKVSFIVRDDNAISEGRVRLDFEVEQGEYDPDFYVKQLVSAAESVLSPKGIDRKEISDRVLKSSGQKSLNTAY